MVRAIRCFKCHEETAVLTYEENRIYKVCCPCGCEYTFEHSSQKAAHDYHLKMVELYAEIDRNAALTAENASLRAQLSASQERERAMLSDMAHEMECGACCHVRVDVCDEPCASCRRENSKFKWRGPQEAGEESG